MSYEPIAFLEEGLIGQREKIAAALAEAFPKLNVYLHAEINLPTTEVGFEGYHDYGLKCSFKNERASYSGYFGVKTLDGAHTLKLKLIHNESGSLHFEETMPLEASNDIPRACVSLFRRAMVVP